MKQLDNLKEKAKKIKIPRIRKINVWTILALISYLNILVFIPLLLSKKNTFIAYHAKQGFALLVVWVLFFFSFYIPVLPWIFALYILICIVYGIYNVLTSKEKPLPIIGKYV